ncbi:HD family phosphohydrolase [Desulfamplus magnetovallimortis]|nr:HDIG domain-containing metalloprotein [Desulfamplus magnetovallimortis]
MLVFITMFSAFLLYPHSGKISYLYEQGDIAERDIKAPRDFFIEDREATQENRHKAGNNIQIVYDYDPALHQQLSDKIDQAFSIPRKLYTIDPLTTETTSPSFETIMTTKDKFESILGIPIGKGAFNILYKYNFDTEISDKIKIILTEILKNGVVANKDLLLKEDGKGIILRTIDSSSEKVVDNLKIFYGPDQSKTMVRIIGDPLLKGINYNLSNLIVDICQQMLRPNITMNRNETEKRIKAAEDTIKPVLYKIKQGEMILREGERVDEIKIIKLNALTSQIKEKNVMLARGGVAIVIFLSLLVIYIVSLRHHQSIEKYHNKNIIFLSLMLILFLSIARIAAPIAGKVPLDMPLSITVESLYLVVPLAAGAMTVCLFLEFQVAMCFSLILSLMCTIIFASKMEVFIFILMSSITGAYWIKECRERKIFITAGLKLALFNAVLAIALGIYSAQPQPDITVLLKNTALAAIGGITAGIITAGLTPVIEIVFSYTTEIKYLELSNLDQPIMRRLMIEAPGTYNHSVIVANLAEAAASAIGVSGLKTKVCAFYHDIGKLDKPLYFIENQSDGKNRHDKISPSMSALVLIQHTKKGVEYAREYKLGQDIMDTIQQHHGTSLIRYFYNKSIKIHGEDGVKESDFRYPGPKPQTRETGIVMLADVVEAALRTLERPTPARIQGRVQELINAIFADGQLEECELTLKDLHQIAKSFNKILTGLYHHRIEYDNKPQEPKKEKNGKPEHTDSEPAKVAKDQPQPDKTKNQANLKRLGI